MINFICSLFINIGDVYRLKINNPFTDILVRVVDIKEGWVQYHFLDSFTGEIYKLQETGATLFLMSYEKYNKEK